MANPRKFSEKIALHNHRQAEETAEFEKVMKEVMEATSKVAPDRNSTKNTLRINTQSLGAFRGGSLPNVTGGSLPNVTGGSSSAKATEQNSEFAKDEQSNSGRMPASRVEGRSRARSQGGPMRRPHDRRLDTSPYYLSPPTDTGWRRTNSDSALHQSTMQGMMDRSIDCTNRGWNIQMMGGPDRNHQRPKSSCDIPSSSSRVPGISIHPSAHDPSLIQIPIANTGSLPDLTNVDFTSPIHALDQDHDSSPYSSSPLNTSPATLSPTSIPPNVRPQNRFHFTPSHSHPNQLTVPISPRYQQHQQNIQLDKNIVNLVDSTNYTTLPGLTGMYQQQCPSTSPSPTLQQAGGYRSPRPSPQSSPSPGRHSAPCSPGATSPLPNEYHLLNQQSQQFQQHFEQLSMDWAQLVASLLESGCTWSAQLQNSNGSPPHHQGPPLSRYQDTRFQLSLDPPTSMSYVDQSSGAQQIKQTHSTSNIPNSSPLNNLEMSTDAGYYSTSPQQLVYPSTSPGLRTTPNTPTSLPEIILTDFSGDDGSRQLTSDFFADELREGLGTLDFEEIQILTNPSLGISEIVEDNFRLDHRS